MLCNAVGVVTFENSEDIREGAILCPEGKDGLAASENVSSVFIGAFLKSCND